MLLTPPLARNICNYIGKVRQQTRYGSFTIFISLVVLGAPKNIIYFDIDQWIIMVWRCSICTVFTTFSLKLLLSHINRLHSRSPDFWLLCGIDGCTEDYRVYNSYYHHVKRRHPLYLRDDIQPSVQPGGTTAIEGRDEGAPQEEDDAISLPDNDVSEVVAGWLCFVRESMQNTRQTFYSNVLHSGSVLLVSNQGLKVL